MRQKGPFRRLSQALAVVLVPALVLTSVPVATAAEAPQAEPQTVDSPPPPAPEVTVNRTVPRVMPIAVIPVFSDPPTDAEIFRARMFVEPFVPIGTTSAEENRDLAKAILQFRQGSDPEDVSAFGSFLNRHPASGWRPSLVTNLGAHYKRTGYYTKATETLSEGWRLAKNDSSPLGKATAERALSDLLDLHMQFGKVEELEALQAEVKGRDLSGGVVQRVAQADRAVGVLRYAHHEAIASAAVAVDNFMGYGREAHTQHPEVAKFHATPDGASLADVEALTTRAGLTMQMAKRDGGDFVVPSILHLKAGHFTALVRQEGGRFLLSDPMLGGEVWMSRAALDEEASGYSLVRDGSLPAGWKDANASEVQTIRGKCVAAIPNNGCTTSFCSKTGKPGPCPPMAIYSFHSLLVSLSITDAPVGYTPPRGPAITFQTTYNQREFYQPQIFPFSNFGARWNFTWLAYIEDTPSNLSAPVNVHVPGGGREVASGFSVDRYLPDFNSRAVIVRTSSTPIRYERQLPDGSMEVYGQADTGVNPRRVFLTERRDAAGNAALVTYDSQLRIVAVTDAIGQVSTLTYALSDPLKITKVTDPFGRTATFDYGSDGKLIRITDAIGIKSEFEYGPSDFIRALTTPYGTTTFATGAITAGFPDPYPTLWVEATDPLGGRERIEYDWQAPELPSSDPASTVPVGFTNNVDLQWRNTYYWDKRAMALHPGDHTKAKIMHWLWAPNTAMTVVDALHSEKLPLENRVWYGQMGEAVPAGASPLGRPSKVGRVLDDGTSQVFRYEYNSKGAKTRETDPLGRETVYEYDTNEIDLLTVKQKNGGSYDTVWSATYNSQHRFLTVTDAAKQVWTYTYNPAGQLLTVVTPPRAGLSVAQRTTTHSYDTDGYLQTVAGPAAGTTATYAQDGYGRIRTLTDADGYITTYDYDALDRPTRTTHPDGTYEETVYNRLDAERSRDRSGRWTHAFHDALRRVVASRDPLGRTTTRQWCSCGSLDKIIDPNGNATTWERDLQGRVTREIGVDGAADEFTYENATSRVKQFKDPKNQTRAYEYFLDNTFKQVTYTNAVVPTPSVGLTWEPVYRRPATLTDGTGTTTFAYHPVTASPQLGAGVLASINGPLAGDTDKISYTYDELGQVVRRQINGTANDTTQTFDLLYRLTSETNPLGTFGYTYQGGTARLASITYPNSQTTTFDYLDNLGDRRLKEVHHKRPGGTTLSKFNYATSELGLITSLTQQVDIAAATSYEYGRDAADQLTAAVLKSTGATPTTLKSYAYGYDNAGNRSVEAIDTTVTSASYNNVNEALQQQAGGALRFAGTVNEPAAVTVAGAPAQVSGTNRFDGSTTVATGTSPVAVVATDPSGNVRTNTYQVNVGGTAKAFTHDDNGNLISDGTRSFEWDAEDRLVAAVQGTRRSEFTYNGLGQRVRILEKDGAAVLSDNQYLWCALSICEERDETGSTVLRRFFHQGVQEGSTPYFYTRDHLGSIREMTDGAVTLRARYDYDPYGRQTKLSGDKEAPFGFTGHFKHSPSGLDLAPFRSYDATLGRWLSEDPIGFSTPDLNLYGYVSNGPIDSSDPTGQIAIVAVVFTPPGIAAMTAAGKATLFVLSAALAGIGLAEMTMQKDPPPALPPSTPVPKDPPTPPAPPATPPAAPVAPPAPPPAPPTALPPSIPFPPPPPPVCEETKKPSCIEVWEDTYRQCLRNGGSDSQCAYIALLMYRQCLGLPNPGIGN